MKEDGGIKKGLGNINGTIPTYGYIRPFLAFSSAIVNNIFVIDKKGFVNFHALNYNTPTHIHLGLLMIEIS